MYLITRKQLYNRCFTKPHNGNSVAQWNVYYKLGETYSECCDTGVRESHLELISCLLPDSEHSDYVRLLIVMQKLNIQMSYKQLNAI